MFKDEFPHTAAVRGDCRIPAVDRRLPRSTQRAISRLLKASNYAGDTGRSPWEFAVTIGELRRDGVAENELRWLVCRGYIEHADEVMTTGNERAFNRHVSLRFGKRSAFVITSAGVAFSCEFLKGFTHSEGRDVIDTSSSDADLQHAQVQQAANLGLNGNTYPKWDRDRRELRIGGKLVKVFKLPSPMQEAILMAFEEEHWPPRIDDPLPNHPDHLPKRRLHDTIKSLNRNQKNSLIRFMGDGTGEGIRWEQVPARDEVEQFEVVLQ
jgi:hypothetical protein